jgi:hypothetical protein
MSDVQEVISSICCNMLQVAYMIQILNADFLSGIRVRWCTLSLLLNMTFHSVQKCHLLVSIQIWHTDRYFLRFLPPLLDVGIFLSFLVQPLST